LAVQLLLYIGIPLPIGQDIIFGVPFYLFLELAVILSLGTVVNTAKLLSGHIITSRLRNGAGKPTRVPGPLGIGPGSGFKINNPKPIRFVIIYFITRRVP